MLKDIQPIALERVRIRAGEREPSGDAEQPPLDRERAAVDRFVALCDEYLARPHRESHVALDDLLARHVLDARDARVDAVDALQTQAATADRAALARYAERVNANHRRIFNSLFETYVELARNGDQQATAELEEAAELSLDALLALADASQRPGNGAEPDPARLTALNRAFYDLHARYEKELLRFARLRLMGLRDRSSHVRAKTDLDADPFDIVQEGWRLALEKLDQFNPVRARFGRFVRYWVGVAMLRFADEKGFGPDAATVLSRLVRGEAGVTEDEEEHDAVALGTVGPAPSVDPQLVVTGAEDRLDLFSELLQITLATPSPPHQLLAFGLVKTIGWTPRRIAAELSPDPLRGVESRLEDGYLEASNLPDELVATSFAPLREALERRFAEVVADRKTLSTYPALHERIVGDTAFRDYYTGDDPSSDITQWWYAVRRRVIAEIGRRRGTAAHEELQNRESRAARNRPTGRMEAQGTADV
jgi:hypothetical protein